MSSCFIVAPWLNHSAQVFIQICMMGTFLTLFFFLYVTKVEGQIFKDQVGEVISTLYNTVDSQMQVFVPLSAQKKIKQSLNDHLKSTVIQEDKNESIKRNNKQLEGQSANMVGVLIVGAVGFVLSLVLLGFCTNMKRMILENIVIVGCLALTEFIFLNFVTRKFKTADPNHIMYFILDSIEQFASEKSSSPTTFSTNPNIPGFIRPVL